MKTTLNVPDGGFGWIIVIICFLSMVITQGILMNFGIFLIYFAQHYNVPKAELGIMGFLSGSSFLFGTLSTALVRKYGFRPAGIIGSIMASTGIGLSSIAETIHVLKFTYLLAGVGSSFILFSSLGFVVHYFTSKRPIAVGILFSGISVGIFIFAPVTNLLLELYRYSGTMFIYSGLVLNCIAFAGLLRPLTPHYKQCKKINRNTLTIRNEMHLQASIKCISSQENVQTNHEFCETNTKLITAIRQNYPRVFLRKLLKLLNEMFSLYLLKSVPVSLLLIGSIFGITAVTIPVIYFAHSAVLKGISKEKAAVIMSLFGSASLIARPLLGFIVTSTKVSALILHNICIFICGVLMLISTICYTYPGLALIVVLIGFTSSAAVSLVPIALIDIIGLQKGSDAVGLHATCTGISWAIFVPLAGYLFDITGSYDASFYLGGCAVIFNATLTSFIPYIVKKNNQPSENCVKEEKTQKISENKEKV